MRYFMDVGGRLSRELVFAAGTTPTLRPGAPLEVEGVAHDRTIVVSAVSRLAARAVVRGTAGTKKLLVILVQWPASGRSTGVISTTASTANAFVFGSTDQQRRSVKQWYEDVSYGQLEWTGDVTSILRIADPGSCDLYAIANRSDAAATAAGYTLGDYTNRMYDVPPGYCHSSAGEIAGPRSWILDGLRDIGDGYQRMAPDHELGHNLGEWHGHGLDCGSDTLTAACIEGASGAIECDAGGSPPCINEYGDAYDVMGNNWTSDGWDAVNWFGIWHEMRLGWVSGRTITDDQPTTAQDHAFTIAPIESGTGDVGLTLTTDTGRRYVVEYRQPLSQDAFLIHDPVATSGVLISMANPVAGSAPDTGQVTLDTRPDSDLSSTYSDWFDAPLGVGQTFTDVDGSFSLRVDSAAASGASVTVHWVGTTALDQMDPRRPRAPRSCSTASGFTGRRVRARCLATLRTGAR